MLLPGKSACTDAVKFELFVRVLQPSSATDPCRVFYSRCACPAGLEKCVHLSALLILQYCAAKAEIWEAWDDDDVSTAAKTSCTSRLPTSVGNTKAPFD